MTYEMLREKRDRVDAALVKLREGPSLSTREAIDDVLGDFMAANDEQEASDVAAAAARDTAALEKERAADGAHGLARPALDGLSSKATPAAVAPPPEPLRRKRPNRRPSRRQCCRRRSRRRRQNLKRRRPWRRRCRARPTLRTRNPQNAARRRSAASWARRAGPRRPPRRARSRAATSTGRRPWGRTGWEDGAETTSSVLSLLLRTVEATPSKRSPRYIRPPRKISPGLGRHGRPSPSAVSAFESTAMPMAWRPLST